MGIHIGEKSIRRDWGRIASAAVETVVQALALGKDGFSAAISAFFRVLENLRGDDDVELRATRLVIETLAYAASATIATTSLSRRPDKPEVAKLLDNVVARAISLASHDELLLQREHLEYPASFLPFADAASRMFHELRLCKPQASEENVAAQFRQFVSEGLSRIRTRDPEYFSAVIDALSGADARSDARSRAWDRYRALLIKRFEDDPLFGENEEAGATLGQVYQPLRAWWDDDDSSELESAIAELHALDQENDSKPRRRHLRMLDDEILQWIGRSEKSDRIRLVSGGPGSGKSTFAKRLAASLAQEPRWRIVFVPLQRLKGAGPLEKRIDEYFRLQGDEPFEAELAPVASLGRDGHQDWVIIFDGLDELTKEGATSESAAQDFASALADWRGRIGGTAVRFIVLGRAPSMQEARRRLGLQGAGTLHVADMLPLKTTDTNAGNRQIAFDDPDKLQPVDQRTEFWCRWAAAKDLGLKPPEAMTAQELDDLTKEPLLAYLLILSGFATERWQLAADNRNRIYHAIFDRIWERERSKPTRMYLNDLGKEGFESLMQALGLAAWRGGGRPHWRRDYLHIRAR